MRLSVLTSYSLNCFSSPLEDTERWSVSKTTESTERVLPSVTGVDRLHREFRITSQRTVSSFCYPAFVFFFPAKLAIVGIEHKQFS